ncbi:MAG: hypothetical protein MRZ79_00070 [Bacteroidia bacterium]|nr:hypothetical protein [Bacteroidia bacterium]
MKSISSILGQLIGQGQFKLALEIMLEHKKVASYFEKCKEDILAIQVKYLRLEKLSSLRLLPFQEENQEKAKLQKSSLEILHATDTPTFDTKISSALVSLLSGVENFCKKHDIYPYTPVVLLKLMDEEGSRTKEYLNAYHPELAQSLGLQFEKYIQEILIEARKGAGFEEVDWEKNDGIGLGSFFAFLDGEEELQFNHFLLGIVNGRSSTIATLEHDNGLERYEFSKMLMESWRN